MLANAMLNKLWTTLSFTGSRQCMLCIDKHQERATWQPALCLDKNSTTTIHIKIAIASLAVLMQPYNVVRKVL